MRTDPAADGRDGIVPQDDLERLIETALRNQRDVSLRALVDGAHCLAGRGAAPGNRKDIGNRLREGPVNGLTLAQAEIELGGQRHRAGIGAQPAARAPALIHEPRTPLDRDREVPGLPLYPFHVAQGENLDIAMPADLHQSRRHGAHGAVVGRERLIELSHHTADGGFGFQEIDLDACVRQIERGLHPPDATAHHHRGANSGVLDPGHSCCLFLQGHLSL